MAQKKSNLWMGILIIVVVAAIGFWYTRMNVNPPLPPKMSAELTPNPLAKNEISIGQNAFTPDPLTAKVGEMIVWINNETYAHDVVGDDGTWKSPKLEPGGRFGFKFMKPGTFTYICSIHPFMHGTIIITK